MDYLLSTFKWTDIGFVPGIVLPDYEEHPQEEYYEEEYYTKDPAN